MILTFPAPVIATAPRCITIDAEDVHVVRVQCHDAYELIDTSRLGRNTNRRKAMTCVSPQIGMRTVPRVWEMVRRVLFDSWRDRLRRMSDVSAVPFAACVMHTIG